IEVTFDIDANGIMHVSAKDKATGKEQSIQIKASSGLSDEEIEQMVRDAEAHAEEDKKFQELVEARNQADGLVHATRKTLKDESMTFEDGEKEAIEAAANELEEVIKGDDIEAIKAKTEALSQASAKMAERMYAQAQAQAEAGAGQQPGGEQAQAGDDVVDAEFEEVKEDKNS
ncbi:MAG: Hsp70 family protein, partial [Kangiellaceae bacterium]|nr:Hsp70 family protein [Kangiellaceae bacterium]